MWQCQGGYTHALPLHHSAALSLDLPESLDRLQCENSCQGTQWCVPSVLPDIPRRPVNMISVLPDSRMCQPLSPLWVDVRWNNVVGGLHGGFSSTLLILPLVLVRIAMAVTKHHDQTANYSDYATIFT